MKYLMRNSTPTIRFTASTVLAFLWLFSPGTLAQAVMSDIDLTAAIEAKLRGDETVPYNRINIATSDGTVTLSGTVSSLAARSRADDIAASVMGARDVINRITVVAPSISGEELLADVKTALKFEPAVESYQIESSTSRAGAVTLNGQVESWAERDFAQRAVETVPGVTSIENQIEVDQSRAYRAEEEIHEDIEARLEWDVRVDDSSIEVLVRDGGRVVISGHVSSLTEKRIAGRLSWVSGVASVDNLLDVQMASAAGK